jgi:hypothetical protein
MTVSLATSIAKETCESINLAYRDVKRNRHRALEKRTADTLVVEEAGQVLYRLKDGANTGPA